MGSNPIFCAKVPENRQKRRFSGIFSLKNHIRGETLVFAKNGEKMCKNELRG